MRLLQTLVSFREGVESFGKTKYCSSVVGGPLDFQLSLEFGLVPTNTDKIRPCASIPFQISELIQRKAPPASPASSSSPEDSTNCSRTAQLAFDFRLYISISSFYDIIYGNAGKLQGSHRPLGGFPSPFARWETGPGDSALPRRASQHTHHQISASPSPPPTENRKPTAPSKPINISSACDLPPHTCNHPPY